MQLPLSLRSLGQLITCFENVSECALELGKNISLPHRKAKQLSLQYRILQWKKTEEKDSKDMGMNPECAKCGNACV